MTFDSTKFLERLNDGSIRIGVIGLGYVGLPLVLAFVEKAGLHVLGFDTDNEKIQLLERGESYLMHLGPERIRQAKACGLFESTSNLDRLGEPDALLIAVPTPLTRQREPDLTYVAETAEAIARCLRPGQLIVLESTTYPGTTDELLRSVLERTGLKCGVDFLLAFSPEREDPGNAEYKTANTPKLVGGVDEVATMLSTALYSRAIAPVIPVRNARVAEATKLTENIFRAVNIALVNELKVIYQEMGIDIWDVLDAAATKPFGFMRFNPGPGLGGHCIPLDPFYLSWKAREFGVATRFIELAGEINVAMPRYVVNRLRDALNCHGKALKGSRILILGVAYKKNIDDTRESPAFEIIAQLLLSEASVGYHDPHIPATRRMRSWPTLPSMQSEDLTVERISSCDAVVIVTDHNAVDYSLVLQYAPLIVDTRGVFREPHPNVVHA